MTSASDAASRTALTLSNLLFSSACVARFDGRLRSSSASPAFELEQHVGEELYMYAMHLGRSEHCYLG